MTTMVMHTQDAASGAHLSRFGSTLAFARREFREAMARRWFLLYTIAFAVLAVAVSFVSLAGVGSYGFAGFGRTTAGVLNLVMLLVPLIALTAGSGAIAGERERGTLLYLLAQPVSRFEILLGKFFGLAAALCCSLFLGFGFSAGILIWRAGERASAPSPCWLASRAPSPSRCCLSGFCSPWCHEAAAWRREWGCSRG